MSDEKKVDGYWLKMGGLAVNALSETLHPDLTDRRKEIIAEYLGELFDNAYYMGIKLGRAEERYVRLMHATPELQPKGE